MYKTNRADFFKTSCPAQRPCLRNFFKRPWLVPQSIGMFYIKAGTIAFLIAFIAGS
jgi:hypothetical protein